MIEYWLFQRDKSMSITVYKACANSIVTLELLSDSVTNEQRKGVINSDLAKFRTNKAKVVSIVNPETKEQLNDDCSKYYPLFVYKDYPLFVYKVGEVIETGFDRNVDEVCSRGIHYFKTYEAALSWYYQDHKKTNGKYTEYYDNGQKQCEWNYKDRKKEGKQEGWYENGQKQYERNYKNGAHEGTEKGWRHNGEKNYEHNYKDGKLVEKKREGIFPLLIVAAIFGVVVVRFYS